MRKRFMFFRVSHCVVDNVAKASFVFFVGLDSWVLTTFWFDGSLGFDYMWVNWAQPILVMAKVLSYDWLEKGEK